MQKYSKDKNTLIGHYSKDTHGKFYAIIHHPQAGVVTQWGQTAHEAQNKAIEYINRHWGVKETVFFYPYNEPEPLPEYVRGLPDVIKE